MAPIITGVASIAGADSITLPAHNVGDLILMFSTNLRPNNTAPAAPAAGGTVPTWTTVIEAPNSFNGISTYLNHKAVYAVATATNHTSGTWSAYGDLETLLAVVISGAKSGTPIGGVAQSNVYGQSSATYPAVTLDDTSGSSLLLRYSAQQGTGGGWTGTPSGLTVAETLSVSGPWTRLCTADSSTTATSLDTLQNAGASVYHATVTLEIRGNPTSGFFSFF